VDSAYRLSVSSALLALITVGLSGCGARTGLGGPETCYQAGEVRGCSNDCGSGVQLCSGGFWLDCQVPATEVTCENSCGAGMALCEQGKVGECQVEPVSAPCSNTCGDGVTWCRDDTWGECEVAPVEESCEDLCGVGTRLCQQGAWEQCLVPPQEIPCSSACGLGVQLCQNAIMGTCNAPQPVPPRLRATVRDFRIDHPDFERTDLTGSFLDLGIVADTLGPDELPVYAAVGPTSTVTSKESFDTWFRDVPGTNLSTELWLQLTDSPVQPGLFEYENTSFFPIDNQLFGNEGLPHNYHFTMEVRTSFFYQGGETFSFEGDDDMWVFINRKLAIDLGGIHEPQFAQISLDQEAARLGLVVGGRYPLQFFFAERKTVMSDFTIRTTIADVGSCP
jgi:fibro-slime domain-containing protein